MLFSILVLFAAFLIEGIGTYVSVVGLSSLFAANMVIIILAIALDIGKVTAVSFLYKYWKKINFLMRFYMTIAAMVLMTITSAGAFGYLSGQFQKAISGTNENSVIITSLTEEQARLQKRKEEIDGQIAKLPDNSVTGRKTLIRQFGPEVTSINSRLKEIDKTLPELKVDALKKNVEVGPILYVAEAFDTTPEKAVKWVILTIIFVFDPLAIALLLAGNFLIEERKKPVIQTPAVEDEDTPQVIPAVEAIESAAPVVETLPLIVPTTVVEAEIVQPIEEPNQESVEFPTKEDNAALMEWAKKQEELELAEEVNPIIVEKHQAVDVEFEPQEELVDTADEEFPHLETIPAPLMSLDDPIIHDDEDKLLNDILSAMNETPEREITEEELYATVMGSTSEEPQVTDLPHADLEELAKLEEELHSAIAAHDKAKIENANKISEQTVDAREIIRLDELLNPVVTSTKQAPIPRSSLEDVKAGADVEYYADNERAGTSLGGTYNRDLMLGTPTKNETVSGVSVGGPSDRINR